MCLCVLHRPFVYVDISVCLPFDTSTRRYILVFETYMWIWGLLIRSFCLFHIVLQVQEIQTVLTRSDAIVLVCWDAICLGRHL